MSHITNEIHYTDKTRDLKIRNLRVGVLKELGQALINRLKGLLYQSMLNIHSFNPNAAIKGE